MNNNKCLESVVKRLRVLLEFITLFYIGVMIVYRVLMGCAIYYHPEIRAWYDLAEKFILGAGIVLAVANVIFRTGWRRSRRVALLYGICIVDALASFFAVGGVEYVWIQQLSTS